MIQDISPFSLVCIFPQNMKKKTLEGGSEEKTVPNKLVTMSV